MFLRRSQCVDNEEVACTERSFPFLLDLNLRTQIFFFFNLESATKYSASTSQVKNRLPALQGKRKGATGGISLEGRCWSPIKLPEPPLLTVEPLMGDPVSS